ncbi:Tad domain-containing protein [Hellea sp.]|nr:Tad domain-containing protein [Hellea sp.]
MTIPTFFKSFAKNTGGSVAIWAAFSTPVLVGGAALSVDASRLYNMDNEMQSASDALARAGAAELDQRSDSLERSKRAIQNLVSNDQKFSKDGNGQVEIDTIRFLKSLPNNDYDDIQNSNITYSPAEAKYVEVKVKSESVATLFPTSLVKKMIDTDMNAKSIAGFDQGLRGVAPVFICNPQENEDITIYEAMETPAFRRRLIKLKSQGGKKEQFGPGNYGWLDPFNGQGGASALKDAIAIDIPDTYVSKSAGVYLRPGNIASMRHAVNTRFDIYGGSFKNKKNDPRYAPAENVTKGYTAEADVCVQAAADLGIVEVNALVDAQLGIDLGLNSRGKAKVNSNTNIAFPLPRDNCMYDGTCDRIGDGNWDFVTYMKVNHNFMSRITIEDVTYRLNYKRNTFTPSAPPSRYAMYRWEIDNDCVPGPKTYGSNSLTHEEGLAQCHSDGPSTTVEDRRIINVAVLNCGELIESGEDFNGRSGPLPVETFVKVFLTEPMAKGKDNILWGEIVGPVVQGQDSHSRDYVSVAR